MLRYLRVFISVCVTVTASWLPLVTPSMSAWRDLPSKGPFLYRKALCMLKKYAQKALFIILEVVKP